MIKLDEIIKFLKKDLINVVNKKNIFVDKPTPLNSKMPNTISFCEKANYISFINESNRKVILCDEFIYKYKFNKSNTYLILKEPRISFIKILNNFFKPIQKKKPLIVNKISNNALISKSAIIYPGAVIGDSEIGDGFHRDKSNSIYKFPTLAWTNIGNNVEIGSNTVIDNRTLTDTIIADEVKIDNFVHIGHSAIIGNKTFISAASIIGENTVLGKNVWVGLNSTISNNINIGDNAKVRIGSVVIKDLNDYDDQSGNFAYSHLMHIKNFLRLHKI
jgi:UDP-3-O-[3-hydroxymyristoyl] glucosamine N-acyltransferase